MPTCSTNSNKAMTKYGYATRCERYANDDMDRSLLWSALLQLSQKLRQLLPFLVRERRRRHRSLGSYRAGIGQNPFNPFVVESRPSVGQLGTRTAPGAIEAVARKAALFLKQCRSGAQPQGYSAPRCRAVFAVLWRPVVVLDRTRPLEEGHQLIELRLTQVLSRHFAPGGKALRIAEHGFDPLRAPTPVCLRQIRPVIRTEPQNGVAVIAVVLVPDAFAGDDRIIELVDVRQHRDLPVRIERQSQEEQQGAARPQVEDPACGLC